MNDLTKEKTMTVKEVAETLNVSIETITQKIRELFPDKMKQGKTTYLNEIEVTAIKINSVKKYEAETELEMMLLQKKVDEWKDRKIQTLQDNLIIALNENQVLKPKALEYDLFISGKDFHEVGTVAKSFDIGRNKFFEMLRKEKILMSNNLPYSDYKKYFKVVYKPVSINGVIDNKPVTLFNPQGISYIAKRFNLTEVK
jgi:phage antirepressor YoqD-like protein